MDVIKNILVMLVLVTTVCELCAAFNCYLCNYNKNDDDDDDCLQPGDNTTIVQCNNECMTTVIFWNNDLTSVSRSCSMHCMEKGITVLGTRTKTTCCTGDKCNDEEYGTDVMTIVLTNHTLGIGGGTAAHVVVSLAALVTSVTLAILLA